MRAYVGLGSNLGDSRQQLLAAMEALASLPLTQVRARSRLYRTPPWGVLDQPDFLNAAVELDTGLAPHALLDALLALERAAGRIRNDTRWGPRTLDLDILHIDGVCENDDRLTLPHPQISQRAFVMLPLCDLAPELLLPGQGMVVDLLKAVDTVACEVLP